MALINTESGPAFDLTVIQQGDLLWGKHSSWDEGKSGFVTAATASQLTVQYHPGIGNVTNHFIVPATEYAEWEIRWSRDLTEVNSYPEEVGEIDDEI